VIVITILNDVYEELKNKTVKFEFNLFSSVKDKEIKINSNDYFKDLSKD
jgi:hypothetical protein